MQMKVYNGSCHCGKVRFAVSCELSRSAKCDCSICRRRGSTMVRCEAKDLEVLEGQNLLSEYQFGTMVALHYFCQICGIYVFHRMRKDPSKYAVNAGCLDGVDLSSLVPVMIEGSKVTGAA